MIVLALDVGEKRIGIAVSDPLGVVARGLRVLVRTDLPADLRALGDVVRETGAEHVLVGHPLDMDGTEGDMARRMRIFTERLAEALEPLEVRVELWDERLSTVEADEVLASRGLDWRARKAVRDQVAAAVFLQEYLDESARETGRDRAGGEEG